MTCYTYRTVTVDKTVSSRSAVSLVLCRIVRCSKLDRSERAPSVPSFGLRSASEVDQERPRWPCIPREQMTPIKRARLLRSFTLVMSRRNLVWIRYHVFFHPLCRRRCFDINSYRFDTSKWNRVFR